MQASSSKQKKHVVVNNHERLVEVLEECEVDFGQKNGRRLCDSPLIDQLFQELASGIVALLWMQDGKLCLLSEKIQVHAIAGHSTAPWQLINTHRRLQHQAASLVPEDKVQFIRRNQKQTDEQAVQTWFSTVLGIPGPTLQGGFTVVRTTESTFKTVASDVYRGLMESSKTCVITVRLTAPLRLFNPCRPIVIEEGTWEGAFRLWTWWPACIGPGMRETERSAAGAASQQLAGFTGYNLLQPLIAKALHTESLDSAVRAVLRARNDGLSPLVLLVAPPQLHSSKEDALVVVQVDVNTTREEVQHRIRNGSSLRDADPSRMVRVLGKIHTSADTAAGADDDDDAFTADDLAISAVWKFALDNACWQLPEMREAVKENQPLTLLEDVVSAFVVQLCLGSGGGGGASENEESMALQPEVHVTLVNHLSRWLPRLLAELVAPVGVLDCFLANSKRGDRDIVDTYNLPQVVTSMMAPPSPKGRNTATEDESTASQIQHRFFGPWLAPLVELLGDGISGAERVVDRMSSVLSQLRDAHTELIYSGKWIRSSWRPLWCPAHGNLTCANVLADFSGKVWLYNNSCEGMQPLFSDFAQLATSVLLECCRLPVSVSQLCTAARQDWVSDKNVAQWLGVTPSCVMNLMPKLDGLLLQDTSLRRNFQQVLAETVAQEPGTLSADTMRLLVTRIVATNAEASEAFQAACSLGKAWLAQLHPVECSTARPRPPPVARKGRWCQCWEILTNMSSAASSAWKIALRKRPEHLILPVDKSPMLVKMPVLQSIFRLLDDPTVAPWQKPWLCELTCCLAHDLISESRILKQSVHGAKESEVPSSLLADSVEHVHPHLDVRFAAGHRFFMVLHDSELGAEQHTVVPFVVPKSGSEDLALVTQDRPNATECNVCLVGWPCPCPGISSDQLAELRSLMNAAGRRGFSNSSGLIDARLASDIHTARTKNLWRDEACGVYEIVEVVPAKDSVLEDPGPGLLLMDNLRLENVLMNGKCVGVAAMGQPLLRPCPTGGISHKDSSLSNPQLVYSRFPCSVCGQLICLMPEGKLSGVDVATSFSHCEDCWMEGRRFDLCLACSASWLPPCSHGHTLQRLEDSPYDRVPTCRVCKKELLNSSTSEKPQFPPRVCSLDMRDIGMRRPGWFRCNLCSVDGIPVFDVCNDCSTVRCPEGHPMVRLKEQGDALALSCRACGQRGNVDLLCCLHCQERLRTVTYASAEEARTDLVFESHEGPGGAKVLSTKPGGPAGAAGVRAGQRLRQICKDAGPAVAVGENVVTLEFTADVTQVVYSDAISIEQDLLLDLVGGAILVKKATAGGLAAHSGVGRGCRLTAVNDTDVEILQWDGQSMLSTATMLSPPYRLLFRDRCPEFVYHPACGIVCEAGHKMQPHYPDATLCSRGHTMQPMACSDLVLLGLQQACDDCHDAIGEECWVCPWCLNEAGDVLQPGQDSPCVVLCWPCGSGVMRDLTRQALQPYQHSMHVECVECKRKDLGRVSCESEGSEHVKAVPTAAATTRKASIKQTSGGPFFHCRECWVESREKYDLCVPCSSQKLQCPGNRGRAVGPKHHMLRLTESPYANRIFCNECKRSLDTEKDIYHCADCWLGDAIRSDRCEYCAEQLTFYFTLNEDARFQIIPGDSMSGISWPSPFGPEGQVHIGPERGVDLFVRMRLRGLLYPLGTRVSVMVDGDGGGREGAVRRLLDNGKYEVQLDGDGELVETEMGLEEHMPAGIWRYMAGQELAVYHGGAWLDVRVRKPESKGNRHLLEELSASGSSSARTGHRFVSDLNTFNHSPLWLNSDAWLQEQRRWDWSVLVSSLAVDVLTGDRVDPLQFVWNLREVIIGDQSRAGDVDTATADLAASTNMWQWLIGFAERLPDRHRGFHKPCGALVCGETATGKTLLLRRIAAETVKSHDGELVPLMVEAQSILQALGTTDSERLKFLSSDFMLTFLCTTYGEDNKTFLFLKQAMHARRLLLLVDNVEKVRDKLQAAFLTSLGGLVAAGHRVVATVQTSLSGKDTIPHAIPCHLRTLQTVGLTLRQRSWLAERSLGQRAFNFISQASKFNQNIFSSVPMFMLFLRYKEENAEVEIVREPEKKEPEERLKRFMMRRAKRHKTTMITPVTTNPTVEEEKPKVTKTSQDEVPLLSKQLAMIVKDVCGYSFSAPGSLARYQVTSSPQHSLEDLASMHSHKLSSVLGMLAVHMLSKKTLEFREHDLKEVCGDRQDLAKAWNSVEPVVRNGNFSLVTFSHEVERGHLVKKYRFAHKVIQHYMASCHIVASWGQAEPPIKEVEEALTKITWHPIVPFLAEQLRGPISLRLKAVSEFTAPAVTMFVARSAMVTSISFDGAGIGQSRVAVMELSKALRSNRTLKQLHLRDNGLGSNGVEVVCAALSSHPVLEELLLSENHIGNQGSLHVAHLVRVNHSITALGLAGNSIGNEGALAIATAMQKNTCIKTLDLENNNIGADPAMMATLSDVLTSAETPRKIDSRFNRVGCPEKFVAIGCEKKEIVSTNSLGGKFKSRNKSNAASSSQGTDPSAPPGRRARRASTSSAGAAMGKKEVMDERTEKMHGLFDALV